MKVLKSKLFWFIIIILGAGIGLYVFRDTEPEYTFATVMGGDVVESVDVSATLEPVESVDVSFESLGMIEQLEVSEGDRVEKGQKLAQLDNSVVYMQLKEARTQLAIVEEDEKLARRSWDDLDPEVRESKKLASKAARAQVSSLVRQIGKRTLVAPMSGMVSQVFVDRGETVSATMPIVRIISPEGVYLEANVPESDIVRLALGQKAEVTFDALEDEEVFKAEIQEIEPEATVIQDVVYYVVAFDLLDDDTRLKPGMSADIVVEVSRSENALYLPRRAVHKEDGQSYVEILLDEAKQKKDITTGIEDDEGNVEILEGLNVGEKVIL